MVARFIRSAAFCSPESLSMLLPSVSFQMESVHALVVVRPVNQDLESRERYRTLGTSVGLSGLGKPGRD